MFEFTEEQAMAQQMLRRWCEKELGVDVRCGWLLDTFGQHPQIPQLMVGCGFDHGLGRSVGFMAGDVLCDGTEEQLHVLRQVANVLSELGSRPLVHRGAVDAHLAAHRLPDADQQAHQR